MKYLILFLFPLFLSSCTYQLTLMPRDGGTTYHGLATRDIVPGSGDLSITIDDTTYSGSWTAMRDQYSGSDSVTIYNNAQPMHSSPIASAMASSSATAASAAMAASANTSSRSSGSALLSSPEGRGLRCEFQYGGGGVGDGFCIDDTGRIYDMQILLKL